MHFLKGKGYLVFCCIFCVLLVLTNILGLKIFSFFGIPLPSAIITYPITFILSGLITEIYGKDQAKFMVFLGFFISFFSYFIVSIVISLPPHPYWLAEANSFQYHSVQEYQTAFSATFAGHKISVFASMLAYLCAQLVDIFVFSKIRLRTKGRFLWLRSNLSAIISQLVDTTIVSTLVLAFGLNMHWPEIIALIFSTYFFKIAISASATPFVYLIVGMARKTKVSQPLVST